MNAASHSAPSTRSGALLVAIVIALMAASFLGAAVLSMATTTRFGRVHLGLTTRAYYLAESGAAYVRAVRAVTNTVPSGTYTLANGNQFHISDIVVSTNEAGQVRLLLRSTGIVNPDSYLEARRAIWFDIAEGMIGGEQEILDLGFDNVGDGELDLEWEFEAEGVGSEGVPQMSQPPEGGVALAMDNWMGNFYLNWHLNPNLDLVRAWENNNRLLSYDVQAKVSPAKHAIRRHWWGDEPIFNPAHLVGIGFRMQPDNRSSYGVSFYRNHPIGWNYTAPWRDDLGFTFWTQWRPNYSDPNDLSNTNVYLTLWSRQYPARREVIAYKRLPASYLYPSPMRAGELDMKPFCTILINLEEKYVGPQSNRVNEIRVYMQTTDVYPRWPEDGSQAYLHAQWQENETIFPTNYFPVRWDNLGGAMVVTNSLFTSQSFDTLQPPEINLHVYDYAINYFDDFAMRMRGYVNPTLPGHQVQY